MSKQILLSRAWIVALIMAWSLFLFSSQRSVAQDTRLEVTITEAGRLADQLASSTSVETLIVRGVLNDADLGTLDGLSSLKHVDLSQADFVNSQGAPEGTLPSYKFYGNKHFETFSLPRNITTIGASCFFKCSALKEVTLPEGLQKINAKVFMSCYLLERINLPNSLESIGEMAFYKTGLISLPESSTLKSIGKTCFWGSKLQDVRLGRALESIGDAAFGGCPGLKSISVSSLNASFTTDEGVLFDKAKETLFVYPAAAERASYQTPKTVTTIKPSAFESTQSLETLIISEGVVGIPNSFCASAVKLTKVYLPSTIKTIDVGAFDNCKELKEFHIRAVEPPVAETGAFGVMFPNYKMNLFVPIGSKALYQAVKVWDDAFLSISEEGDPLQVEQIVLVSAKQKDEYIGLNMTADGDVTVTGASYDSPGYYKLEESTITITGKVKKLDCSSNKLLSVDASKALSLEQLLVDDNEITSITLGELPNLVRLYVGSNHLTSIDLSGLPQLADFSCWGNKLVSIDLSHNANLGSLVCRENLLTGTLDLSHCPLLQELSCFNNNIEGIKLATNNRLGHLEIQRNKIKGDAMVQLLSALPKYRAFAADDWDDYMGLNPQGIYLLEITDLEGNFAYEDEVAIATAKGWPVYSMNIEKYGEEKPQPYSGEKRPTSEAPHRIAYGFFQSNQQFGAGQYGFGHFYLDEPEQTQSDLTFGNDEGVYAGAACDGIIYACTYVYTSQRGPRPEWFISYNVRTKERKNIGRWADPEDFGARVLDMTYDYTTHKMYATTFSAGSARLVEVDLATGAFKEICQLESSCGPLAVNSRGEFYTLTSAGVLNKIDPASGKLEEVIDPQLGGVLSNQSLEFDRTDGDLLYWVATTSTMSDKNAQLIRFDLSTPATPMVKPFGKVGEKALLQALFIPFAQGGNEAPAAVSDLVAEADVNSALVATVQWKNPAKTFSGKPLSALSSVKLYRNGVEIHSFADATPDQLLTYEDKEVPQAGEYLYTVSALNEAGEGERTSISLWVGLDAPAQVTDIELMTADGSKEVLLTWQAPKVGAHGATINKDKLSYDLYRSDSTEPIAKAVKELRYSDKSISELSGYYYTIKAINEAGESTTHSDWVVAGPALTPPVEETFEGEEYAKRWRLIDGNHDGWSWFVNSDFTGQIFNDVADAIEYVINPTLTPTYVVATDEWLISPPITFDKDKRCKITFRARAISEETIEITTGRNNNATDQTKMTNIVIPAGTANDDGVIELQSYEAIVDIPEGVSSIGMHLISPINQNRYACLQITDIKLEQVKGNAVTIPTNSAITLTQEDGFCTIHGDFLAVTLYSLSGEVLLSTTKHEIDMRPLPRGSYIIAVSGSEGITSFKVVR